MFIFLFIKYDTVKQFISSHLRKMVLTANQVVVFFENNEQMAMPRATRLQVENEGITTVADLGEFDKATL